MIVNVQYHLLSLWYFSFSLLLALKGEIQTGILSLEWPSCFSQERKHESGGVRGEERYKVVKVVSLRESYLVFRSVRCRVLDREYIKN